MPETDGVPFTAQVLEALRPFVPAVVAVRTPENHVALETMGIHGVDSFRGYFEVAVSA